MVLESDEKFSLNEDGSELTILDVNKLDEGDYTCIARNKAGEKEGEVSLNVFGKTPGNQNTSTTLLGHFKTYLCVNRFFSSLTFDCN